MYKGKKPHPTKKVLNEQFEQCGNPMFYDFLSTLATQCTTPNVPTMKKYRIVFQY
jgi:hypothetical protein